MIINKKTLTTALLVGAVVSFVGSKLLKTKANSTVEVVSTTVETPAKPEEVKTSRTKVTRLEVEPEQVLFLNTQVDTESVELLIGTIEKLSDSYDELFIVLDSPGGSVFDGSRLISYMEGARTKINTVVYGLCASMCAQIAQHGNKRYMVDRGVLMFHPAAGGVRGTVHEMKSLLSFIDLETRKLDAYIADRANIPRDQFDNLTIHNLWIAADDALKLNLSDGTVIISTSTEEPKVFVLSRELVKRASTTKTTKDNLNPLKDIY